MTSFQLPPHYDEARIQSFIDEWKDATSEDTTAQTFFRDLCRTLAVEEPPKGVPDEAFRFEKRVPVPDGTKLRKKKADVYRRDLYVWENKAFPRRNNAVRPAGWLEEMREAYEQAKRYGKFLADESSTGQRPPILAVCDIGREIFLWDTFSGGTEYGTFENRREYLLTDLTRPRVFQELQWALSDPLRLNPYRESGRVTLAIAKSLGRLADRLEHRLGTGAAGEINESIAKFMMACIFTMFAEGMDLLSKKVFTEDLTRRWQERPQLFKPEVEALWRLMNEGGSDRVLGNVLQFNGGLFRSCPVIDLTPDELQELAKAAAYDWTEVEPSIFGTLLEQSLKSHERSRLGAHFTPREYIERVVRPTVIEPLRYEWQTANAAAVRLAREASAVRTKDAAAARALMKQARQECLAFLTRLRDVKILDPACGTGNFLYVSLDLLKRLEKEVLVALRDLGARQEQLVAVLIQPDQFFGIERKPWSKEITELVLWIGYLQWWRRERGNTSPPEPVLRQYGNIIEGDAVLKYDAEEDVLDERGKPVIVTRQGKRTSSAKTKKASEIAAPVVLKRYINAQQTEWEDADFIVSNPPFIGNKRMRERLGPGYAETVRAVYEKPQKVSEVETTTYCVPSDVDYVAYWWHKAAMMLHDPSRRLRRFGFITTNRIRGIQSGAVLRQHLGKDLLLQYACPDHPWVDPSEELGSAAVRISITVARRANEQGAGVVEFAEDRDAQRDPYLAAVRAATVAKHSAESNEDGAREVDLAESRGCLINADLTIGADATKAAALIGNGDMCFQGMNLVGKGFRLMPEEVTALGIDLQKRPSVLKRYIEGHDLKEAPVDRYVIDFFGYDESAAQVASPVLFDHVVESVKPDREKNGRPSRRDSWWIFGEPVERLRKALDGLKQYIATIETSKHRFFVMLDVDVIPDHKLYAIASDDYFVLGVLSSRVHLEWALRVGGALDDRPTWTNTTTFYRFPFPEASDPAKERIRGIAKRINTLRQEVLSSHPNASLTNIYDAVMDLRVSRDVKGHTLTPEQEGNAREWRCNTLLHLHDELDLAVCEAYGLESDVGTGELLEHLVDLNRSRADEEGRGAIRWLRRDYQESIWRRRAGGTQVSIPETGAVVDASAKLPVWPTGDDRESVRAQVALLRDVISKAGRALTVDEVVSRIAKPERIRLKQAVRKHLQTLEVVGAFVSSHGADGDLWSLGD